MSLHFHKGDQVEVIKQVHGVNTLTYFSATVLGSPSFRKLKVLIEYNCSFICDPYTGKPLRESVDLACLRPMPPDQVIECFKLGDSVDVYCDNGWQKGTVKDLLENSKYVVKFDGKSQGIVAELCNLRLHREWDDGSWFPPFIENVTSSDKDLKPRKLRIKIKCPERESKPEPIFGLGTRVEVRSDEEGYVGAWYDATIVGKFRNDMYMVEYLNLLTDDGIALMREMVSYNNIRLYPPLVSSEVSFRQFEYVDAWYNDGWWEGLVSEVLNGCKYVVYFSTTNEIMEFEHSLLRHHQEWVDGEWKKKEKCANPGDSNRSSSETLRIGTKVEVKSDEVGFQGAWFRATIIDVTENGKFVVQYHDLLTEDGDHLKEEANASDARPTPPIVQREHPFREFEKVDAWYNDGWWVGNIAKVCNNSKYLVHFENAEDLEFEHGELRPHQEYIYRNWVVVQMDGQL